MIYYNNNNLGEYTNSEKLAQLKVENGEWSSYGSTDDEIVMQGDNSGYVFASQYVAPEPQPEQATELDKLSAQVMYTAIMTDTLIMEDDEDV